jgi:hypothetical protein
VRIEIELRTIDRKIALRSTENARRLASNAATLERLSARRRDAARAHATLMSGLPPQALDSARRRLGAAEPAPQTRAVSDAPRIPEPRTLAKPTPPVGPAADPGHGASYEGATSTSPFLTSDPDQKTRTVWVLPSGRTFHRRDCHFVEGHSARQIPVQRASSTGLERCRHCCPTVR